MGMSSLPGPAGVVNSATDGPMRALRAHHRGGPEQLVYEQAHGRRLPLVTCWWRCMPPASPRPSWAGRRPGPTGWGGSAPPVTPGHELSGVVAALGFGTSGLTVGEAVYGLTDWYRDGAGGALVAVVGGTAVGPPRQDARWVFFVVEADRAGLAELAAASTPASYGRSSAGCCPGRGRRAFQAKRHGGLPGKLVLRVAS
jgi:hypothetical protein